MTDGYWIRWKPDPLDDLQAARRTLRSPRPERVWGSWHRVEGAALRCGADLPADIARFLANLTRWNQNLVSRLVPARDDRWAELDASGLLRTTQHWIDLLLPRAARRISDRPEEPFCPRCGS